MNLQLSIHRLYIETAQGVKGMDYLSRERDEQILDVSRMSDKEREVGILRLIYTVWSGAKS